MTQHEEEEVVEREPGGSDAGADEAPNADDGVGLGSGDASSFEPEEDTEAVDDSA
jgi:hypothetical protein